MSITFTNRKRMTKKNKKKNKRNNFPSIAIKWGVRNIGSVAIVIFFPINSFGFPLKGKKISKKASLNTWYTQTLTCYPQGLKKIVTTSFFLNFPSRSPATSWKWTKEKFFELIGDVLGWINMRVKQDKSLHSKKKATFYRGFDASKLRTAF